MEKNKILIDRIKTFLMLSKISQKDFSRMLKKNDKYISNILAGRRTASLEAEREINNFITQFYGRNYTIKNNNDEEISYLKMENCKLKKTIEEDKQYICIASVVWIFTFLMWLQIFLG